MIKMQCEILISKRNGQLVAGTLSLDGGNVVAHANPGFETLMQNVMNSPVIHGKRFMREDDPEGWFNALPYQYNGSYMRARMVQD
jgi:hypothetical protein